MLPRVPLLSPPRQHKHRRSRKPEGGTMPGVERGSARREQADSCLPRDRRPSRSQQEPGPCRQLSPGLRAAAPGPPGCAEPGWRGPASCGPTQPTQLGDEFQLFLVILCEKVIFKMCFFLASNYHREIWFVVTVCCNHTY